MSGLARQSVDARSEWSAFHLFLSAPANAERYLVEQVAPLAKSVIGSGRADGWFFIRYWEGGPHLRLRLRHLQEPAVVERALSAAIGDYTIADPIRAEEYYDGHGFDGEPINPADLPWYGEGTVVPLAYEPEIGRYGGPAALPVNETLFQASSDLAHVLVRSTPLQPGAPESMAKRTSIALLLMVATIGALRTTPDVLAEFFAGYARFWQNYAGADTVESGLVGANEQRLAERVAGVLEDIASDGGNPLQKLWVAGVSKAIGGFRDLHAEGRLVSPLTGRITDDALAFEEAVLSMLGSQMHMLNNRLAISPPLEYSLARRISSAIREGALA